MTDQLHRIRRSIIPLSFLLLTVSPIVAQDDPADFEETPRFAKKGFHTGLYLGSYFPNSYSASLYDGYGFDFEENRNSFDRSWMYQKIYYQYGGYGATGLPDYISEALGIQPGQWTFKESDMPTNMRYKTAISVGFNGRYSTDGRNAVLLNANAAVLKAAGNFTMETEPPPNSTQINNSIKTFNISGGEQRLLMQVGYQHLFGEGGGMYFLMEGGMHATLAKFDKNEILINDLQIDLFQEYFDQTGYTFFTGSKPVGLGFGAFAGAGIHFETSGNWNLQFVYNPLLERVNIGYDPKYVLSHALGLRAYYKL